MDDQQPAQDDRSRRTAVVPLVIVVALLSAAVGGAIGFWVADRFDAEAEWCERAEAVSRAARAGAPWDEAVDEWTLAQNQPSWAADYNSFEVLYGVDPSTRVGTPEQAQAAVAADLLACDSKGL